MISRFEPSQDEGSTGALVRLGVFFSFFPPRAPPLPPQQSGHQFFQKRVRRTVPPSLLHDSDADETARRPVSE